MPRANAELEAYESVSCYTYIYEDRVVHIWEASDYEYPEQEEEDEIARAKIIWERLSPAADWFYCHTDGTRIGGGEAIPHHAHIIIGLRDEVDPDWWHKAMSESVSPPSHWYDEVSEQSDSEIVQPECLAPARLGQPGATAQVDDKTEVFQDSDDTRGKLESCTVVETLKSEPTTLRIAIPDTLPAIISFERQSAQMFFSPDHAIEDFRRKVKELWNIPEKSYYLLINGTHEGITISNWPPKSMIRVCIKGPLGGTKPRIKVHLKVDDMPKIHAFEIREDALLGDVNDMIADVFGNVARAGLYQQNAILDIADGLREWLSATGGKSEISLKPDVNFKGDEVIEQIPVMETVYDGESHWVRNIPDWRRITEERFDIRLESWKLDKPTQDWEEGTFNVVLDEDSLLEEEETAGDPVDTDLTKAIPPETPTPEEGSIPMVKLSIEVDEDGKVHSKLEIRGEVLTPDASPLGEGTHQEEEEKALN
jgi:hypothetical protein